MAGENHSTAAAVTEAEKLLERPFGTLPDLIRIHARHRPRHAALIQEGRTLDYGALDALMDRVAAALQRDGLEAGDTLVLCGANLDLATLGG